ncbi:MAG TPA: hypothetical protein VIK53_01365 [Verrucomicrobiae bacterium]
MKTNTKLVTLSQAYKYMPAAMVLSILGWVIKCMTGNAAFPQPPIPLVAAVPPDPDAPVDMTTRMNVLNAAIKNAVGGGTIQTGLKNAALAAAFEGLDANGFYVQTNARTNLALFLTSGYQARSTNRGQSPLDMPAITGIANDISTQLDVHVTPIANAVGYEMQTCLGTGAWTTVMFSTQARTITLTGLTTGTVVQVRVRALGGSTGQSDWSMPGSSIVD